MFDKKVFSNILIKIYKTYKNQRDFADATGANRGYLSQYINLKLDNPPSPKILKGIADASKGITNYDELMQICGYIPTEINNNFNSLDVQLSESIFNDYTDLLGQYDLSNDDILDLKQILINRDEQGSSLEQQLNNFATNKSSNANKLFSTLVDINDKIKGALINLHKNGYVYPLPVYKNTKNIDLFLVSDIVNYANFNIPFGQVANNYFALLIDNDRMFPLLDIDDIAIIERVSKELDNGQIVAAYSITRECCLIGKLFKYDNIIELSYLNSKSEKFIVNDIKFLGKVVKAENKSAFK